MLRGQCGVVECVCVCTLLHMQLCGAMRTGFVSVGKYSKLHLQYVNECRGDWYVVRCRLGIESRDVLS